MYFFIFVIGLFIGSFLNVLADRLSREESIVKGRSHCEKCKKELAWLDLIPLLSFISLKGKCRYCKTSLSFYYPTVELVTGILFVVTAFFILNGSQLAINNLQFTINYQLFNFQTIISLVYYLFLVSSLIVVFFADLKYGIIPDKIIFPAIFISFLFLPFTSKESWLHFVQPATFEVGFASHLLSAFGAGLFFLALFLITKGRGMGFGDVKFAFLMGLILGFPNIVVSLYIAFLTGAIVGCILIIWRKKKLKGASIPFGPFLVFGTFLALFWGDVILQKIMLALSSTTF